MKLNKGFVLVLCFVVAALFVATSFAQETTAGLQGAVKDPQGAVVSKATVEVTSPALIGSKKVETDSSGYYRLANLPPGTYTITVTAQGFRTLKQSGIGLIAGALPTVDLKLEIGGVEQTVEVSSAAPLVDVTQSKVQTNVTEEVLNAIPKGRSFQSVIGFAPGARQEPLQSKTTDQGKLNGFQIDGASDSENVYMSEGLNTTAIYGGGVGANVPFEFVQEVQVKSSSFEAEFGGATGGVVNVIQKRGGPQWHGSVFTYWQGNPLSANDNCINRNIGAAVSVCNLRLQPGTALQSGNAGKPAAPILWADRNDGTVQRYLQKQDKWSILEPGYEVGGPLLKDRLWFFSSYVPSINDVTRTVNFNCTTGTCATSPQVGPFSFTQSSVTHNFLNRFDYRLTDSVRLFAAWQGGYNRLKGINLPGADSVTGQVNNSAGTDPRSLRPDTGSTNPLNIMNFGGDWSVSSKMVVTARYGYFYTDNQDRGKTTGTRYVWQLDTSCDTTKTPPVGPGCGLPSTSQHTVGFANITSNAQQAFDIFSRRQFTGDVSYFVGHFLGGTHNLKAGYAVQRLAENVAQTFNTSLVNVSMSTTDAYSTASGSTNTVCASVIAKYGKCAGPFGWYTLRDGVLTNGNVSALNHSLYGQDAWTIHGLTINGGVRVDKEFLPPYRPGASSIAFGFGDKIAPRIGAAYDLLHNGKVKLYGSYGKFYDIMKYSLPRGSFGGDRWHDCVYTLTSSDYTTINPANIGGKFCPDSGPASGATPGDFIENFNWRASAPGDPTDPVVDPNMHPMSTHETVFGADWAITPTFGFESRYARKRLDWTIEDMSLDDGQYYIGNPGSAYSQLLHRPLPNAGINVAVCPTCPNLPKATRDYDGIELRLIKRASDKWFGQFSYTWSRLNGNYPGLNDTYFLDGGGGRHEPNNNRSFDLPQMVFDGKGHVADGPLPTDRPNTFTMFGYYRLKWLGQETLIGMTQQFAQGSPQTTCLPTVDSQSSCMFVAGQGNWINFHQAANGDIIQDSITNGKRAPWLIQTDLSLTHELKVSKTHEQMRLGFSANVPNLFNQHVPLALYNSPLAAGVTTPDGGVLGWDYLSLMNNFNYLALMNDKTAVCCDASGNLVYAGPNVNGKPNTLASRYGQPIIYQGARNIRLQMRFTF